VQNGIFFSSVGAILAGCLSDAMMPFSKTMNWT